MRETAHCLCEKLVTNTPRRLKIKAGNIEGGLVSCTGSQFCGLAMIETKQTAERYAKILEEVRIRSDASSEATKRSEYCAFSAPR